MCSIGTRLWITVEMPTISSTNCNCGMNPQSCLDRRCHNVDQAVCSLAVLTFQRAGLVLALGGILFCDQLRGAPRRNQGCRLRLCLVHRSVAPFEFLYSTVSVLNPMTWIVITASSAHESCFAITASGAHPCTRIWRVRIHVELLARIHYRQCPHTDND